MKYTVLCLSSIDPASCQLISKCYRLWRQVYTPILTQSNEKLLADSFYRCRLLSVLTDENQEPVAFCLHNLFQTRTQGTVDQSYFENATTEFRNRISQRGQNLMSIEWVTVHPHQRGKFTKIQPVDLIMGLSLKLAQNSPAEAVMGFSRTDLKADQVGAKFGVGSVGEVIRHQIPCRIMYSPTSEITAHPFSRVQAQIDHLWNQKFNNWPYLQEKPNHLMEGQQIA